MTNRGALEATTDGALVVSGTLSNTKTIQALSDGTVTINGGLINSGTVEALDTLPLAGFADMTVSGTVTNPKTIEVEAIGADDAFMTLSGTIDNSGTIVGSATGSGGNVALTIEGITNNSGGTIVASGNVADPDEAFVYLSGSVNNSGGHISAGGSAIVQIDGATISGGTLQTTGGGEIEAFNRSRNVNRRDNCCRLAGSDDQHRRGVDAQRRHDRRGRDQSTPATASSTFSARSPIPARLRQPAAPSTAGPSTSMAPWTMRLPA